MKEIDFQWDKG